MKTKLSLAFITGALTGVSIVSVLLNRQLVEMLTVMSFFVDDDDDDDGGGGGSPWPLLSPDPDGNLVWSMEDSSWLS